MPLFCRHNRYTAECPICSKGTVLDPNRTARRSSGGSRATAVPRGRSERPARAASGAAARVTVGPHALAGPYEREDGVAYHVRLERVPGGLRLGSWARGALERRAPELPAWELPALVRAACEREVVAGRDAERLRAALEQPAEGEPAEAAAGDHGSSPGLSGELREELRVERLADERVRVGRWIYRPGPARWELVEAPPMLPAQRYAQAIAAAVARGVVPLE